MSNPNERKPWFNEKGEPLSIAELKEITKSWDEKTWQDYSESLEHYRREHLADDFESLVRDHDREEGLRRYFEAERGDSSIQEEMGEYAERAVASALNNLSHLEREVLILTLWEGKTEREIAECLEHSKSKIRRIYERALKKMRDSRTKIEDLRNRRNFPNS